MSRTHRLLDLLQELRARRRPVTADTLARQMGVSMRTLYRDIDVLRARGARIDGGAGFGYLLRPGFTLPPLMFEREEIEAILLGVSWVARREDLAMEGSARAALAKIAAVLPRDLADTFDVSGLLVGRAEPARPLPIDARVVRDALWKERKLSLAYVDAEGAASERVVWPVAIAVERDSQVLAAWCELRADYRHFRLDRIRALEVLPERPPRRRITLFREWRETERDCVPEGITERDGA